MKFSPQGTLMIVFLFLLAGMPAATEEARDVLDGTIVFEPARVHPGRSFFVALTVTAPRDTLRVRLPDPAPFFEGFDLAGYYDVRHELPDGSFQIQRNFRLQPRPGAMRFRMAPMAIEWHDAKPDTGPAFGYQLIPAVYFERVPIPDDRPSDIAGLRGLPFFDLRRRWWLIVPVATLLILFAAGMARILRGQCRTLSPDPRRQACAELDALAQERSLQRENGTDLHAELTLTVRRFIERKLEIPASGCTTAEFLAALRDDYRVSPAWVARVADFLESADTIKYSGLRSDREASERALTEARRLIETFDQGGNEYVAGR